MKALACALPVVAGLVAFVALAEDPAPPSPDRMPATVAKQAFALEGTDWTWRERDHAMLELNAHYVGVRREALALLGRQGPGPGRMIPYGSPLHCAMRTVRFWRMADAAGRLMDLIECRLDPSTVPVGVCLPGSAFYPAAQALAALPVRTEALFTRMTGDNLPMATWVLEVTDPESRWRASCPLAGSAVMGYGNPTRSQERSALAPRVEFFPPTRRQSPSGSRVAVWPLRGADIWRPGKRKNEVAGS